MQGRLDMPVNSSPRSSLSAHTASLPRSSHNTGSPGPVWSFLWPHTFASCILPCPTSPSVLVLPAAASRLDRLPIHPHCRAWFSNFYRYICAPDPASSLSYFLHGSWSLNIFSVDLIACSFVWTDFSTMREKAPWRECVCLHYTEHSCSCSSFSCVWVFTTPWTATRQAFPSFTISQSLLGSMSIEWMILCNHLILCCPLLLLPSIFPRIRVFSRVYSLHQVAKVLEVQLPDQSFQWIFRVDFL